MLCFLIYRRASLRNTRNYVFREMEFETALNLCVSSLGPPLGLSPLKPKQVGFALVQYFITRQFIQFRNASAKLVTAVTNKVHMAVLLFLMTHVCKSGNKALRTRP